VLAEDYPDASDRTVGAWVDEFLRFEREEWENNAAGARPSRRPRAERTASYRSENDGSRVAPSPQAANGKQQTVPRQRPEVVGVGFAAAVILLGLVLWWAQRPSAGRQAGSADHYRIRSGHRVFASQSS
jgi:hypothetical protein